MRGKGELPCPVNGLDRITPAYAGKSPRAAVAFLQCQDHPRLCGEKLIKIADFYGVSRITPAYAGKRAGHLKALSTERDHPRLCGEKAFLCYFVISNIGSPPPMRGKVFQVAPSIPLLRITPAYAGKRKAYRRNTCGHRDHPRLCGEKPSTNSYLIPK